MEDILNFLKNCPTVEVDEDIEYYLEKLDIKTNQKYYRFFQFSCKPFYFHSPYSLINQMGWTLEYFALSERNYAG